MPHWVLVAVAAYLILAIVNLLDKFLVSTALKNSRAYAFAACYLGLLSLFAAPWLLSWPGCFLFIINLANGAIFALALWALYEALRRGEASRILVLVGGLTPVFSLLFSIIFLRESFSPNQWLGMGLILLGVMIIALLPVERSYLARVFKSLRLSQEDRREGLLIAVLAALAYSVYFMGTKYAYASQPFVSAFIWTRVGAAILVTFFLLRRSDRLAIFDAFRGSGSKSSNILVIVNQAFGSLGFVLQNYAIFLGSVVLVNALQGVQYAFLLFLSSILALLAPRVLKENFSAPILTQKIAAVSAIAAGLYFLAF